jgi:ribokinase
MTILVAGSLHLDVIVNAPYLPRADETVTGSAVAYAAGGKGGNQAIAAARMGARVVMAGRVGSDGFAGRLRDALTGAGVDIDQVQTDPGPSGMSVAIVDAQGDYGAVIVSGANLNFDPDAVTIPAGTTHLLLQNELPGAANSKLAQTARAAGVRVILNAAPAREIDPGLIQAVDILIVNRVEAADLLALPDITDAHLAVSLLARLGPPVVILTLGAGGLILHAGAPQHLPAPTVRVISTHGAGDAFIGALAAGLDAGQTIAVACHFAQTAAALHVSTAPEARGTITPEQVRALIG